MKYAVEMGSGAIICVRIRSGIQKFTGGIHIQAHRQKGDLTSLFLSFQNKVSGLKYEREVLGRTNRLLCFTTNCVFDTTSGATLCYVCVS
jgi:hypothetical protein